MKAANTSLILLAGSVAFFALVFESGDLSAQTAASRSSTQAALNSSTLPTATTSSADRISRIGSNLGVLIEKKWMDTAALGVKVLLSAILWGVLMFFAGILLGLLAYFGFSRMGLLNAQWTWYRYIRWIWILLFVLSTSVGFAYAGVWIGLGRSADARILEDRILDKAVEHIFVAAAMDQADYQMNGQETAEQIDKVLAEAEAAGKMSKRNWRQIRSEIADKYRESFSDRRMFRESLEKALDEISDKIYGMDTRLVVGAFMAGSDTNGFLALHPNAGPVVMVISDNLQKIRQSVCDLIYSMIKPHIYFGLFAGLGLPVILAGLFQIPRKLARQKMSV